MQRPAGVVGAAVERQALGREKARHRPAAVTRQRLRGIHVDRIDVRPFFAVDLDADEVRVHLCRRGGVLERFVGHDVTPVTRRIADRQQDRDAAGARLVERRRRPRPPVDRIVLVLQQVRARLTRQPVRHHPIQQQRRLQQRGARHPRLVVE